MNYFLKKILGSHYNHSSTTIDLNSPTRFIEIQNTIQRKSSLKNIYLNMYQKYQNCINLCPSQAQILEIGSGAGFVKDIIPQMITSDIIPYAGVDRVIDATRINFPDHSLDCICMFGVLHHIPDTPSFFREAERCLVPGGRLLMIEPYFGWISTLIYRYLHHEPCDFKTPQWEFASHGPLSDANIALPALIFERDIEKFSQQFAKLSIIRYEPHSPLQYWLSGGLKPWSLLPAKTYHFANWLDKTLIKISPKFGSFVDIELIKI